MRSVLCTHHKARKLFSNPVRHYGWIPHIGCSASCPQDALAPVG